MKKYLIVSGDRLTEFPTILFVHNENKITVYSAVEQSRKTWQSYVDRQKTTSIERLASRFSYANTDFGVVDNKKQLEIDKIIKSMPAAVKPITAGLGDDSSAERRARAKLQRRDRYGRFAEMGGGFSFSIRGLGGAADKLSGRVVGTSGTDDIEIEVIGNKTISDGIYALPASKGETVKAILSLDAVEGLPENKALVDQSLAVDVSEIKALSQPSDWTPREVPDGAPREWVSQDGLITRQFADGYVVYEMDVFDDADTSKEVGRGDSWVDIQKASADFRENEGVQTQPASTATESTATPVTTGTQKDRAEDFSEAEVEKLRQRQTELEAMPVDELNELFSDGEYIYVVHAGSEEIKGDVFNPAMTVGSDELVYEGNTKNINRMYSDKYIAEYENNRSTLRTLNHIIEQLKNGEMIDDQMYPRTPDDDDKGSSLPTVSSVLFDVATREGPYLNFPSTMRQGKPWPDPADLEKIGITREELIDYLEKVGVPLIQKKIDSKQQIVDQLRADDGQFTSSYEIPTVVQGARLHGYGGRYGEGYDPNAPKGKGESFDIGNRQERQGIHIARVKIGTDADRLSGGQTIHANQAKEVHMVGEHEVVASLTTPTWIRFAISQDEKDRFGEDFFKAWMEKAVNADKEKRRVKATIPDEQLPEKVDATPETIEVTETPTTPGASEPDVPSSAEIIKKAEELGVAWREAEKGVSEEEVNSAIKASIAQLKKTKELGLLEVPTLSDDIKKFVDEFARGKLSMDELRQRVLFTFSEPSDDYVFKWARGQGQLPMGWRIAMSRQVAESNGDSELVEKIDEFTNFISKLDSASDEELTELFKRASIDHSANLGSPIIQTPDVRRIVKGAGGVTVHSVEERKKDNLSGTTQMGEDLTINARRKVETMYGLPFAGEGVAEDAELTALRPISGHSLPRDTAAAREQRLKNIYGDDFVSMYDFPVGSDVKNLSETGKYGDSHIVLNDSVRERTKIVNGDAVSRFNSYGAAVANLDDVGDGGVAYADPIGMLYSLMTGDFGNSIAGPMDPSYHYVGKYNETATLGTFDPSEVRAIYVADLSQLRREDGKAPEGLNESVPDNLSLLIDYAKTRDKLLSERNTEVVAELGSKSGYLEMLHPDNVELFNSTMTSAWIDRYQDQFSGTPKEVMMPNSDTTPYEAYLRHIVYQAKAGNIKFDGRAGVFGETRDGREFSVEVLEEELARLGAKNLSRDSETPKTSEPPAPRVVNGVTQRETRLPQGIVPVDDFSEAVEKGLPWSPLLAQSYPPEIQEAIDKFYEMTDREKLANIGFTEQALDPEKRAYDKEELIKIGNEIYQYFSSVGVPTDGRERDLGWTYDGSFLDIIINADKGGSQYSPAFLMTTALIQRANSDIKAQMQIESGRVSLEGIMEIAENFNHDRVMTVVPLSAIDAVLGTRRIMSQFEVGESMGYLAPGFRSTLEADQYGYPPNMQPSSRPIYGVSVPERMTAQDFRWSESTYGELKFIMKNEVQSRTTYTMGDSANADARPAPIGTVAITSPYDSGKIHAEAQIHGSVSLDDVLEVVVREDTIDPSVMQELREKVRAAGLIFTVIQMAGNDFLSFVDLKVDGAVATIVKAPESVV